MRSIIPYSTQYINNKDIRSVKNVLLSKNLTSGKKTLQFEYKIKSFIKCKYSLAVINASSALILACRALNVEKNDIVWTSNITYVASINAAIHCGAKIDLIDINLNDYNICLDALHKKLIYAKKNKKLPKVIVVVHLGGYSSNLKKIKKLSKIYKFKIIEDASHAFGSKYENRYIGDCYFSDICVFSFHPVKVITTAEGGAITTNNKKIFQKIKQLRENGIEREKIKKKIDPNFYDIVDLGYNFRINEINSSLGISQIEKTRYFIKKKRIISEYYFNKLKDRRIFLPKYNDDRMSSWHLFIIRFDLTKIKKTKAQIVNFLKKKKIFVNTHYIPLNYLTFIKKFIGKSVFKNSNKYYNQAISIPIYPHLTRKEQDYIIKNIFKSIK
jgi:dTDP-4-amino-4,6-dideoxygalactose transaminase